MSRTIIIVFLAVIAAAIATPIVGNNEGPNGRLLGGTAVNLGQVPHMASIRAFQAPTVHICGATIISNRYVLTTAQCTDGRLLNMLNVIVGSVTLNAGGVTHRSANITLHPGYDRETLANDISLVYTATVITTNVNVQILPISANIIATQSGVQVSGWGSNTIGGGQGPNNLQRITTNTITNEECRERHNRQNAERITDNKICTLTRSSEGTCYGDEGGGLILGGQLIAVASWQVPCGTGVPDVYERVAPHRLWISSLI